MSQVTRVYSSTWPSPTIHLLWTVYTDCILQTQTLWVVCSLAHSPLYGIYTILAVIYVMIYVDWYASHSWYIPLFRCFTLHCESKKHSSSGKCWLIFKSLSVFDSAMNLQQDPRYISHHTLCVLLHYFVKYKRSKIAKLSTYLTVYF